MKQVSTLFLRGVIFLIGLLVLALCVLVFPMIIREMVDFYPVQWVYLPVLICMALSTIPFYVALYQAVKLLNFIDKNKAFSELSVKALSNIKYCAIAIGVIYTAATPFLFMIADGDDAPGVLGLGLIIILAASAIATFATVLQKLLQNAIEIKSENDLTV